jgi:hypothetical protein
MARPLWDAVSKEFINNTQPVLDKLTAFEVGTKYTMNYKILELLSFLICQTKKMIHYVLCLFQNQNIS